MAKFYLAPDASKHHLGEIVTTDRKCPVFTCSYLFGYSVLFSFTSTMSCSNQPLLDNRADILEGSGAMVSLERQPAN